MLVGAKRRSRIVGDTGCMLQDTGSKMLDTEPEPSSECRVALKY